MEQRSRGAGGRSKPVRVKCPRCGADGCLKSERIHGRVYMYVRHRRGNSEKKCYLGPRDEYVAVQRVYGEVLVPLSLRNVAEVDLTQVLARLIDAIRLQAQRYALLRQYEELRALYDGLKRLQPEIDLLLRDIEIDLPTELEREIAGKLELEERA